MKSGFDCCMNDRHSWGSRIKVFDKAREGLRAPETGNLCRRIFPIACRKKRVYFPGFMHRGSVLVISILSGLTALAQPALKAFDFGPEVFISVRDQEMAVVNRNETVARYRISTSKFGIGDSFGSYKTPAGTLWVCNKIGDKLPPGSVIKSRSATGEVLPPNAPGRDPIVTRVIWLRGLEDRNHNAYARCIYIHGTTEERTLGRPVSYGCIRMRSKDVITLYDLVRIGTHVTISEKPLASLLPAETSSPIAWSN